MKIFRSVALLTYNNITDCVEAIGTLQDVKER